MTAVTPEVQTMSLNWNVTKVANYQENFPDAGTPENHQWNPVTIALVWLAIPCAWGWELTEQNYQEAFTRISMYEHAMGAMRSKTGDDGKGEEIFTTLAEVQGHIGMTVNVSPESKAKFATKLAGMLRNAAVARMKEEEKAAAEYRVQLARDIAAVR